MAGTLYEWCAVELTAHWSDPDCEVIDYSHTGARVSDLQQAIEWVNEMEHGEVRLTARYGLDDRDDASFHLGSPTPEHFDDLGYKVPKRFRDAWERHCSAVNERHQ